MTRLATRITMVAFLAATLSSSQEAQAAPTAAPAVPRQSAPKNEARAEELYDAAMKLIDEMNFAGAVPLLEKSNELDPAMGTQYHLAACYEQIGRAALAWTAFTQVADEAKQQRQAEREKLARDRANAIKPRIAFLGISLPPAVSSVPGLHITLDGKTIPERKWKTTSQVTVAVDLGSRLVTATAPGKIPWRRTIALDKAGTQADVAISEMQNVYVLPRARPLAQRKEKTSTQRKVGWGFIGLAGAGMTAMHVGTVLMLTDLQSTVPNTVAGVGAGAGVLSAVVAGIIWDTAPETKEAPTVALQLVPAVRKNGGLGMLQGQF